MYLLISSLNCKEKKSIQNMETMKLSFPFVFLLLIPISFFIFKLIKPTSSRDSPIPPGPNPWPVIGSIFSLGAKPHISLAKLAQIHGPLFSLKLGSQLTIVGSSPVAAREILKIHDKIFAARHVPHTIHAKAPELNLLSVVWASECTEEWKILRTICRTELFSSKEIESKANLREKKVKQMVDFLVDKEGQEVKILELVFTTIINVLSGICFSKDFIDIRDEQKAGGMKEHIREIMEVGALPNFADFFPILSAFDVQGLNKKFLGCVTHLFACWDVLINERKEENSSENSSRRDLLDVLLAKEFTNSGINHLIFDLFVGGSDTTSSTIEWLMTELIKNEEIMNNVRVELAREVKTDLVNDSDLPRLSYLNACVKETLRLHPPGPTILHRALETCKVMNYTVPKDSQILVNLWALGRDCETWEDPLKFKPSRFLNLDMDFKGNDFEFLPFSAGRRMCPGLPLAAKIIPLITASLVHCFDWCLPSNMCADDLDMNEKYGITLMKEQPLILIPKIRK